MSPQHYHLVGNASYTHTHNIIPSTSMPGHIGPPPGHPFSIRRIHGTSGEDVKRSNAFKENFLENAFIETPTTIPPTSHLLDKTTQDSCISPKSPPRSRIPLPTTPTGVNLSSVNNVSKLLTQVPPEVNDLPARRSSRLTRHPSNYKVLHNKGTTGRGEEENGQRRSRKY